MHKNTTMCVAAFALLIATAAAPPDLPDCIEIDEGECKTVDIPLGDAPLGDWADSASQHPVVAPKIMDEDPSLYGDDFLGSGFFSSSSPSATATGTMCNIGGEIGAYAPDAQSEPDDTDGCPEVYLDVPYYYWAYNSDAQMWMWNLDYVKKGPVTVCPPGGCP